MSVDFIELDRVETRIVGALRLVDGVTAVPLSESFLLDAPGTVFMRNRSGLYVISRSAGLLDHEASFDQAPNKPDLGKLGLVLRISDPSGRYLPRQARVDLPRDPASDHFAAANSLFQPIDIPLYPAPAANVAVNWAVLRVSVAAANGDCLGGALLRVLRNGQLLARGLSDWRGEALLSVAGVPVTTFSEDAHAVVISEIEVTLEVLFDPATGSRLPQSQVMAGQAPLVLPCVDPDALQSAGLALPHQQQNLFIAARRRQSVSIVVG